MIPIVIIDYGMGNLRSVQKAFEAAGADAVITSRKRVIENAPAIVLPGVGAFKAAMENLRRIGCVDFLSVIHRTAIPFLGICLGLQVLFSESDEDGRHRGLNVFRGMVSRFTERVRRRGLKIPHMGWNTISRSQAFYRRGAHARDFSPAKAIFRGVPNRSFMYFVHSYCVRPSDLSIVSTTTDYGGSFVSSIAWKNIVATQFHPEKSGAAGLRIIKNFLAYAASR